MRLASIATCSAAIAFLALLCAAAAQSIAPTALQTLEAPMDVDAPQINKLTTIARTRGLVRVIARVARPANVPVDRIGAAEVAAAKNQFVKRAQELGVAVAEPIAGLPLVVVEVTADQLRQLAAAGLVSEVAEDVSDPPTLQDSIPLVNADDAANLGATGAGQTIAILDTGVEATHPFFGGRIVSEACFSTTSAANGSTTVCPGGANSTAAGSAAPCGNPGCNHGTHVAGIAAGLGTARRGVAPQANIIAIQVFSLFTDLPGGPQTCANNGVASPCIRSFTSDQIRGLQRVFDLRNNFTIAAANMSLGGGNFATCDTDTRKPLVDQLRGARIATVISSGNGSSSTGVGAPGCITTAITVGNTMKNDTLAGTSDSADVVDLLAPGTNITSSVLSGNFGAMSGTSMAAPHVAGAFAALRSVQNLTVDQIEQALESTGVPITDTRNNLTRPRINLEAAVQMIQHGWKHNDLTIAAGGAAATINPAGYTWDVDKTQHVVYRGTDGHIHELWFSSSTWNWSHNDLTIAAGGPAAASDPAGYTWDVDKTQHVVYRGTDGHIHELWFSSSTWNWSHNDLTIAAGGPAAASDPAGYTWDVDKTQHVVYRGTDGHIHELWFSSSTWNWSHNDLTIAAGGPAAASDPAGYTWDVDKTQHVVYRGTDGHIHELWFSSSTWNWSHNDLTITAGGAAAASDPAGYTWDVDKTQHAVYRGTDGHIHELWFSSSTWNWSHNDLTIAAGGAAATINPAGYTWDVDKTQHVVYRGTDGHIHELWFSSSTWNWSHNDLTIAAGGAAAASDPAGYTWDVDKTQHVVSRGTDGHIHELWFSLPPNLM